MIAGFSGTGFKIAPAVGMAELITKGRTETVEITPLRLSRYAEGKPLMGEHPYGRYGSDENGNGSGCAELSIAASSIS